MSVTKNPAYLPPVLVILLILKTPIASIAFPSIVPRRSVDITSSKWSIGVETQDRNLTIFSKYDKYLPGLGAKRARLQGGWSRCDPNGTGHITGVYNFAWLDDVVFKLADMGIKPWIELSYGNSAFPGGGGEGPGAGVPNTTEALDAFAQWSAAVALRYVNITDEFEIWNEPRLFDHHNDYARLAHTTCIALHKSRSGRGSPKIYYGAMSGAYVDNGVKFLNGTLTLLKKMLAEDDFDIGLSDCVHAVTYHGYTSGLPEDTFRESYDCNGSLCSIVSKLNAELMRHVPNAVLIQGEAGAPARRQNGGAMEPRNWTEIQQMKWNLRYMVGDAAHQMVKYSSLFTAMDVCYRSNIPPGNIGSYGLLAATCAPKTPGSHVADNKSVDHVRPAYRAAQMMYTLFDDMIIPVKNTKLNFKCTRNATNSNSQSICETVADNFTKPLHGMHCDLERSTNVAHYPISNEISGPKSCLEQCCSLKTCNCWTWSTLPVNSGCWLKHYDNGSSPLVPANGSTGAGGYGGVVAQAANRSGPFNPMGYTFSNITVSPHSTTHVVVWDAVPLQDSDHKTECNISVIGGDGPDVQGHEWLIVAIENGTVFKASSLFSQFQVELSDTPILIARSDALPAMREG
eukprot:UC4_evm2s1456